MTLSDSKIETAISTLEHAGLTRYEATCYATLLALGESEAKEIRQHSNIPLAKVYQTLNELKERGFVTTTSSLRPTRYSAAPPKVFLTLLEKERSETLVALNETLEEVEKARIPKRRPLFWPFNGEENLAWVLRKIIPEAKEEVFSSLSANLLARLGIEFKGNKERGIQLRAIAVDHADSKHYPEWGFTTRRLLNIPLIPPFYEALKMAWEFGTREQAGILIVDNTDSVIALPIFPKEQIGVWVMDEDIITVQKRFVNFMWEWLPKYKSSKGA
ncbi:MAG: TrmB family transcriptional regulator [Candidatus Heimdallarchaeota archaeon]